MKILEECLSYNGVGIYTDSELLQHVVDVGALLLLSSLTHYNKHVATLVDVGSDVLQFLHAEGCSRASKEQ